MDLRQLECFLEVAEQLHFGRAAQALHLGQPTVSETVRRLERELGGPVFERTTRRVTLTPLGEAFLADARPAYEQIRRAFERGRDNARQQALEFRLGYSGDLGEAVLDRIATMQKELPGVLVSLHPMTTPRQVRQLRNGRLHAAIGWEPELDEDLDAVELEVAKLVGVVPSGHPFAARGRASLGEIAAEPLIAWPRTSNPAAYDRFATAMDGTGLPWTLVGAAAGPDNVAARVLSGFGIGVVFDSFAQLRPLDGITYVPLFGSVPAIRRTLLWRRDERHRALPRFVELLRSAFSETPIGDLDLGRRPVECETGTKGTPY